MTFSIGRVLIVLALVGCFLAAFGVDFGLGPVRLLGISAGVGFAGVLIG